MDNQSQHHNTKHRKSRHLYKTVKTVMILTWYRHFQRNGGLNQILRRKTSRFHYGSKVISTLYVISKHEKRTSCAL